MLPGIMTSWLVNASNCVAFALTTVCSVVGFTIALFRWCSLETRLLHVPHLGYLLTLVGLVAAQASQISSSSPWLGLLGSVAAFLTARTMHTVFVKGVRFDRSTDLGGKVAIVTGANSGIGAETAFELARAGARVIMACRNAAKSQPVIEDIRSRLRAAEGARGDDPSAPSVGTVEFMALDLSSLSSVRQFAADIGSLQTALHILVNNAGAMFSARAISPDGHELTLATNHLGHFLLTKLMLPHLCAAPRARVVVVSSSLHNMVTTPYESVLEDIQTEHNYSLFKAYSRSKLYNLAFAMELRRRLRAPEARRHCGPHAASVIVNGLNPGNVLTDVMRDMHPLVVFGYKIAKRLGIMHIGMKTPEQGAWTSLHAATSNDPVVVGGGLYLINSSPATCSSLALDEGFGRALWERTERLTN